MGDNESTLLGFEWFQNSIFYRLHVNIQFRNEIIPFVIYGEV